MTRKRSNNPWFTSDEKFFIKSDGIYITNDRNSSDFAWLDNEFCSNILVGADGYPKKIWNDAYCIGGGIGS